MKCRRKVSGDLQTLESVYTLYYLSYGMHRDVAEANANTTLALRYLCNLPLIPPVYGNFEVRIFEKALTRYTRRSREDESGQCTLEMIS